MRHNTHHFYSVWFPRLCFLGVLIASCTLRVPEIFSEKLWPDEALYVWNAQRLIEHPLLIFSRELNEFHPPGFSLLLNAGRVFLPGIQANQFMVLVFVMFTMTMMYRLGCKLKNEWVGLFSTIFLFSNYLYLRFSSKMIIDGLLIGVFILLASELISLSSQRKNFWEDGKIGIIASFAIFIKWTGFLGLPLVAVYYLLFLKEAGWREKCRRLGIALGIPLMIVAVLFTNNYIQMGRIFPYSDILSRRHYPTHPLFYLIHFYQFFKDIFIPIFAAAGIFYIIRDRSVKGLFMIAWFILFVTGVSFGAMRLHRYALLFIPAVYAVAAYGLNAFISSFFSRPATRGIAYVVVCIIYGSFCGQLYDGYKQVLQRETYAYVGYQQAAEWIKKELTSDTIVLSNSTRAIRYFTGSNYTKFGGTIMNFRGKPADIEKAMELSGHTILVIDTWGPERERMLQSKNKAFRDYLERHQFQFQFAVMQQVKVPSSDQLIQRPVCWIYERKVNSLP